MTPALLSMREAASILGIGETLLRDHVAAGEITYVLLGRGDKRRRIAFAQLDLDRFKAGLRPSKDVQVRVQMKEKPVRPAQKKPKLEETEEQEFAFLLLKHPGEHDGNHWVYVFASGPFTKVGISTQPDKRLAGLQSESPHAVVKVTARNIGPLHAKWAENGILKELAGLKHKGEWLNCTPDAVIPTVEKWCALARARHRRFLKFVRSPR